MSSNGKLQQLGLRQYEWDKTSGDTDPPFASANRAIDRHNREIEAAYRKGYANGVQDKPAHQQADLAPNIVARIEARMAEYSAWVSECATKSMMGMPQPPRLPWDTNRRSYPSYSDLIATKRRNSKES